jgi:hypothetical protein
MPPSLALRGFRTHAARITHRAPAVRFFGRAAVLRSGKEDELRTLLLLLFVAGG